MAIVWSTIEQAIHAWAEASSGLSFVWINQEQPRLAKPFGTLAMAIRGRTNAQPERRLSAATPGQQTIVRHKTHTLQVQIIGGTTYGDDHASARVEAMRDSLFLEANTLAFRAAGFVVQSAQPAVDLTAATGTVYESRASLDIFIATLDTSVENVGWIETVNETVTVEVP